MLVKKMIILYLSTIESRVMNETKTFHMFDEPSFLLLAELIKFRGKSRVKIERLILYSLLKFRVPK